MRIALFLALVLALPPRAEARPKTGHLIGAGAAMAVPTYFLGVVWHEGSHAIWGKAFGAHIKEFQVLPSRDPRTGAFYFGYVRLDRRLTPSQFTWFLVAPKLTDIALLGTYGILLGADAVPENRYGQMALAVLATGAWVDFSKDVFSTSPGNDMVKAYRSMDLKSTVPMRALHAALSLGGAYLLYRGYRGVFRRGDGERAFVLPVLSLSL